MVPEARLALEAAEWAGRQVIDSVRGGDRELVAALAVADATIAARPDDPAGHFLRGVVNQTCGRRMAALADLAAVVRLDPGHARGWLLLSEVLAAAGEWDRSRAARAEALRLDPTVG
jgi:predicted Zn-dependent protease